MTEKPATVSCWEENKYRKLEFLLFSLPNEAVARKAKSSTWHVIMKGIPIACRYGTAEDGWLRTGTQIDSDEYLFIWNV